MIESGPMDHERFGAMLDEHHAQLRDGLGISTPKLKSMIDGCKAAGALCGKLNAGGSS